jgi:hypothetical protein
VHEFSNLQQEKTIARDMVIHWYYEKLPKANDHYEQEMAQLMHKAIDDNLRKKIIQISKKMMSLLKKMVFFIGKSSKKTTKFEQE